MHLGNGLICPMTGIPMLGLMAGFGIYAFKKAKNEFNNDMILPVICATIFVFALQMMNFSIPNTTSSGHIIGAILLCSLLGKNIAFLAMGAILLIQSLLFNDGALIAYGCNLFNMGFLACFIAYPFVFKSLENKNKYLAIILSSVVALQLASIACGVELFISGSLKGMILNFVALIQLIHLPIGLFEGIFSALVLYLVKILDIKKASYIFMIASFVLGGYIFKFASNKPDGLEWSLLNVPINYINNTNAFISNLSLFLQEKIALFNTGLINIVSIFILGFMMFIICRLLLNSSKEKNAN